MKVGLGWLSGKKRGLGKGKMYLADTGVEDFSEDFVAGFGDGPVFELDWAAESAYDGSRLSFGKIGHGGRFHSFFCHSISNVCAKCRGGQES